MQEKMLLHFVLDENPYQYFVRDNKDNVTDYMKFSDNNAKNKKITLAKR